MGWNCLDYCVAHPAFLWLWRGTQAVLFTVASSVFPLQPRSWPTQSPSQDLFIYTLGLHFSGIQEVQQYGRVGRNGMSPTREMCTARKLFFPYFGNSWGFGLNSFNVQGGKKVFLNILVKSEALGEGREKVQLWITFIILYQVLVIIQGADFVLEQESLSFVFTPAEVRYNIPGRNAVSGQGRSVYLLLQKSWYRSISQKML